MTGDFRSSTYLFSGRLTLDTIALCAFGYRFNSFYREDMVRKA